VKVVWSSGEAATVSERDIQNRAAELIADPNGGSLLVDDPGVDAALRFGEAKDRANLHHQHRDAFRAGAGQRAGFRKGRRFRNSHTGNQWQSLILPVLAKALGRSQDKIVLRSYLLGGGFGRRLDGDYAVPAALAAKATRQAGQDGLHAGRRHALRLSAIPFDAGAAHGLGRRGPCDGDGSPRGSRVAHRGYGSVLHAEGRNGVPYDILLISGADHWYTVGAQRVRALRNDLAERTFRPGYLRSVGAGWINWALESFMDEAAPTRLASIQSSFGCGCSMAPAEMPDRRRTPWVARTARRLCSPAWPRRRAGVSRCRKMSGSASQPHSARNARCPRGWPVPLGCGWTVPTATSRWRS
jgi:isoquinoline 1-oxidoreductase beta subunit